MGGILATRNAMVKHFPTSYLLYLQEGDNELASAATSELLARLQSGSLAPEQGDRLLKSWFDIDTQIYLAIVMRSRNFERMEPVHQVSFTPTRTCAGQRANLTKFAINVKFDEVRIDGAPQPVRFKPGSVDKISVSTGTMSDLAIRLPSETEFLLEIDAVVTLTTVGKSVACAHWEIRESAKLNNDPGVMHRPQAIGQSIQFINSSGVISGGRFGSSEYGREDSMFPYGRQIPAGSPTLRGSERMSPRSGRTLFPDAGSFEAPQKPSAQIAPRD